MMLSDIKTLERFSRRRGTLRVPGKLCCTSFRALLACAPDVIQGKEARVFGIAACSALELVRASVPWTLLRAEHASHPKCVGWDAPSCQSPSKLVRLVQDVPGSCQLFCHFQVYCTPRRRDE